MIRKASLSLTGLCYLATIGVGQEALGQTICAENAMIVFDGSASMAHQADPGGEARISTARKAIAEVLPDVTRRRRTGLITYGGNRAAPEQDPGCFGIELKVPIMIDSAGLIISELEHLVPGGKTPLSHAVQLAVDELASHSEPGIVVVVTDGLENCLFNPCKLGSMLKEQRQFVRVHVIGFFLGHPPQRLSCLPRQTGGVYAETNSLETLVAALRETLGCQNLSRLRRTGEFG